MTWLDGVGLPELREADGLLCDILGDLDLRKATEAEVLRFQTLYGRALRNILLGRMDSVESLDFGGELGEVLAEAERILGPELAAEAKPVIRRYLERSFKVGQAVRGVPRAVQLLFDRPRQEALDWLVEGDGFWLGKVFPEHLREPFRDTIAAGLEEGLGRRDIGRRLRGLVEGTADAPGKIELYNRVAATSVNRANNWGGVFSLQEAGIDEYVIRAVLDERTSKICRFMDGKVFQVARAMSLVNQVLEGPPETVETLSPWPVYDSSRDDFYLPQREGKPYLKEQSVDFLQDQGLSLPPYHANCRTVYVVVRI